MRIKIVFIFYIILLLSGCDRPKFNYLDGGSQELDAFEGQWLLINYWAAWCKPCLKEIPELNLVNKRSDVVVLGFNYDELQQPVLKNQVSEFNIQYRSITNDPAPLFNQVKPNGLPATMLIDKHGVFLTWLYGAQTKESLSNVLHESSL